MATPRSGKKGKKSSPGAAMMDNGGSKPKKTARAPAHMPYRTKAKVKAKAKESFKAIAMVVESGVIPGDIAKEKEKEKEKEREKAKTRMTRETKVKARAEKVQNSVTSAAQKTT